MSSWGAHRRQKVYRIDGERYKLQILTTTTWPVTETRTVTVMSISPYFLINMFVCVYTQIYIYTHKYKYTYTNINTHIKTNMYISIYISDIFVFFLLIFPYHIIYDVLTLYHSSI